MIKRAIIHSFSLAFAITTIAFTFVPETCFEQIMLFTNVSNTANVLVNRVLMFLIIYVLTLIVSALYYTLRRKIVIKGNNYSIIVKYGDIFKQKNCKKLICFDECFTTDVGDAPYGIKPNSICGQFLSSHSSVNIEKLIEKTHLKPLEINSAFQNQKRYQPGTILQNNEFLLMAFAKLNKDGIGGLSREEYISCLTKMWEEIDKYYASSDVCIPIIGSGSTRMNEEILTQQYLLDIIIASYKMSAKKIKSPHKLIIVCKKRDDFSLNKIGDCV